MVPFEIVPLDTVKEQFDPSLPLAFDTETDGFYGRICLAQFYQAGWDNVLLVHNPNHLLLAAFLSTAHLIMHNASYDVSTIQEQLNCYWAPKSLDDTLLLGRLKYYRHHEFSLDAVLTYFLNYDPYARAGLRKKELQSTDWAKPTLTPQELLYAAIDVYYLPALVEECATQQEEQSYQLDLLALNYSFEFQRVGMPVDEQRVMALHADNLHKIEELAVPINVNSWKQVRPYIGEDESDALALVKFELQGNDKAARVNATRKALKVNSFLKKYMTDDGRIYGKFTPSARSGRFTCKDQNLQQLPRSTKGCFGFAPEDDKVLVFSDFAQLELRCACVLTGEERMYKLMQEGGDLHNYVAEMTFGENFTKQHRQITKTENFNLLYGGSAGMLQSILIKDAKLYMPEEELKRLKQKWHNLWPTLTAWQEEGIRAWRAKRPWSTPLGRKYIGKLMTDQLNIAVQGFGADVAKLAMHYMYPKLRELHESVKLCNFIHDSYIIEGNNDKALYIQAAKIVADSMQEAWSEMAKLTKLPDLKMPVDVRVGYNWGDMEAGKNIIYKLEQ
jgi:DNA polymerase I-like protein with 3'-5' exonuclease and polymerase domains